MNLYPAVDIRGGRCVRLTQGKADAETHYFDDPVEPARVFAEAGSAWIHVVDLDGAFGGEGSNRAIVHAICGLGMHVELGGGIRSMADLEAVFALGVSRAIIGTQAVRDPSFVAAAVARFGERIAVGIDARDGKVATEGWVDTSALSAVEFAQEMEEIGVGSIIYTDISRDGMLSGPNVEAQEAMLAAVSLAVIASGGVSELDDIRALRRLSLRYPHLDGVIVGKALYEKRLTVEDALAACSGSK